MDRADSCRRAASEAVADVEPPALHDRIETTLTEASMVPGVLTLESAATTAADGRAVGESEREGKTATDRETARGHTQRHSRNGSGDTDGIATQAAGVQLIYEGLRLTRSLAHDEPWAAAEGNSADDSDLDILAADILVARGFYLLARTDAAGKAVRTVQKFGRDQTRRDAAAERSSGPAAADGESTTDDAEATAIDANLERDILELAVRTGAAAVGDAPSQRLLATAESLADAVGTSFPPAADCLADLEPMPSEQSLEDPTTDRATSATDP